MSKEGVNGDDDDDNYDSKAQIELTACQTLLNISCESTLSLGWEALAFRELLVSVFADGTDGGRRSHFLSSRSNRSRAGF